MTSVLICGAGQLGSRYLQGLAKCRLPLEIHVQDIREQSLEQARQRWNEVAGGQVSHSVSFHTSLDSLPRLVDIAILATTADARPQLAAAVARRATVRFWVLEKLLAQGEAGIDQLQYAARNASGAWVNIPRRMMSWHQQIRSELASGGPLTLEVRGGQWGLACNAIHFLDLLAWWSGETLTEVSTGGLNRKWFESKRPGFLEVSGTVEAFFSGGSRAMLSVTENGDPLSIILGERVRSWEINEAAGRARRSDGIEIAGRVPYQSEMTSVLVESLLQEARCDLPTLEESAAIHRVFLRSMTEHWRLAGDHTATSVAIT